MNPSTGFYLRYNYKMTLQDILISIIVIGFSYALIPQVYKGFKEKRGLINLQTSIITSIGMYSLSIIYLTLNFYFSSIISFLTGILWTILFVQNVVYK